jgi:hypothetical protein
MTLGRFAFIAWLALVTALAIWVLTHPDTFEMPTALNDVPTVPIPTPSPCPYGSYVCQDHIEGPDNGSTAPNA